jgi:hypothetical protein
MNTTITKITIDTIKEGERLQYREQLAKEIQHRINTLKLNSLPIELEFQLNEIISEYKEWQSQIAAYIAQFMPPRVLELFEQHNSAKPFIFPSVVLLKNNRMKVKYGVGWTSMYLEFDIINDTLHKENKELIRIHETEALYPFKDEIIKLMTGY